MDPVNFEENKFSEIWVSCHGIGYSENPKLEMDKVMAINQYYHDHYNMQHVC